MVHFIEYIKGRYDVRWNNNLILHGMTENDVSDIVNACKKDKVKYAFSRPYLFY